MGSIASMRLFFRRLGIQSCLLQFEYGILQTGANWTFFLAYFARISAFFAVKIFRAFTISSVLSVFDIERPPVRHSPSNSLPCACNGLPPPCRSNPPHAYSPTKIARLDDSRNPQSNASCEASTPSNHQSSCFSFSTILQCHLLQGFRERNSK